jgi:exopolysaccharide biosynthesis polyprenyl glycosylphosphotransferase
VVGLTVAFLAAGLLTYDASARIDRFGPAIESLLFVATLPAWVVLAKLYGLYVRDEERADHSTADDLVAVFHLVTVGAWGFFVAATLTGVASPQLARMTLFWLLAVILVTGARAGARAFCRRQVEYLQNTIVIGNGSLAQLVVRKVRNHPEYGLNLVGTVRCGTARNGSDSQLVADLGTPDELPHLVQLLDVERVIVACPEEADDRVIDLIRSLKPMVQVDVVPRYHQVLGAGVRTHTIEGLALVALPTNRLPRSSMLLKRSMDVVVSAAVLILGAPLFALVALAVKLDSRGPVFFRQTRMGAAGRTFEIVKFRTMTADADELKSELAHLNAHVTGGDARMFKIPHDPRVTRVGAFLRRFSLDELPQLLNVLRGEMSLVGPRPLIIEEDDEVRDWARRRLDLRPGMTGLWQVHGSSRIAFGEMVDLDYFYVTNWSLWGDIGLLLRTVPVVLRGSNGLD